MQLSALIEYFIPDEIRNRSINEYFRGRILVVSSAVAFFSLTGFTVSRGMLEGFVEPPALTLFACTCITFSTPFLYRMTGSVVFAGLYLVLSSSVALMVFAYIDGGFHSTALLWYPILPLFGVFFSGLRYGIAITTILALDLLYMVYAHHQGAVPENLFTGTSVLYWLYFTSICAVIIILMVLAAIYLVWQQAVQKDLLAANQAKNEFLSGMSHELRTPLNSIMGFSEVLDRGYAGDLNKSQLRYLSNIRNSGSHMLSLVNDLLDVAKIESGDLEVTLVPARISSLLRESVDLFANEAEQRGISLIMNLSELDPTLRLDSKKIKQVIINLLSNAMKFSPGDGEIRISAMQSGKYFEISVDDQGPGIAPEQREKVFDRFYQVHEQIKTPGTGLGLALSRHFTELHHGKLLLTNSELGGCRFVLQLPLFKEG